MGDRWSDWLLERRFGGDTALRDRMLPTLREYRDKVIAGARIRPGDVVLDVGCGDGLLGMAALDLVGDTGQVIFSDISADLLDRCREIAGELGAADRSRFVHTGLPGLAEIPDASVDVVMTRSVLIYVIDKAGSFTTFHRVLRVGGRLSMFEPINRFHGPGPDSELWGFDLTGLEAITRKVKQAHHAGKPDNDPMLDFDERDLLALAESTGLTELRLEYQAEIGHDPSVVDWEMLLRTAPNPLAQTYGELLNQALDPAERDALSERLRGRPHSRHRRHAVAYLTAQR
jgi:arsenite methyltransferase